MRYTNDFVTIVLFFLYFMALLNLLHVKEDRVCYKLLTYLITFSSLLYVLQRLLTYSKDCNKVKRVKRSMYVHS